MKTATKNELCQENLCSKKSTICYDVFDLNNTKLVTICKKCIANKIEEICDCLVEATSGKCVNLCEKNPPYCDNDFTCKKLSINNEVADYCWPSP